MDYPLVWRFQPQQQQKTQQPLDPAPTSTGPVDLQDAPSNGDGGTTTYTSTTPEGFTRDDIKRARQQEKDKLYPEIQKLKEEVNELRTIREKAEAEQKTREDEAAADLREA